MTIFKEKELIQPNFIQRILKKQPQENALIEINNLLVINQENLKNISIDNVLEISKKYKVDINIEGQQTRINLFAKYVDFCLTNNKLEENRVSELDHLKQIYLKSQ
jgi:hypothetical protein